MRTDIRRTVGAVLNPEEIPFLLGVFLLGYFCVFLLINWVISWRSLVRLGNRTYRPAGRDGNEKIIEIIVQTGAPTGRQSMAPLVKWG